jgi:hypothetical protein
MKSFIIKLFQKPSARSLAQAELEEVRRELLKAQTARDWAEAQVSYRNTQVVRLEAILRNPV